MSFWGAVGWFVLQMVISMAISYALRPKPKVPQGPSAAGLDEFQVPTAQVGREFPVLFGSKNIKSQNVVWYGDYTSQPVRKKVSSGGLFSSSKYATVNHRYYLGMHMVLAHDIEKIYKITIENETVWTGDTSTNEDRATINKPGLFGGDEDGGGLDGVLDLLKGSPDQLPHEYLKTNLGENIPAWRGVATVVLHSGNTYFSLDIGTSWVPLFSFLSPPGFYFGTSEYLKPWGVWSKNIYNSWYPSKAEIGTDGDMNPAHIIYETITNDRWGMGYNGFDTLVPDVDEVAFTAAADTLYNEGFGLSVLWDRSSSVEDFITEVLSHIEASLYTDIHTGKFVLKLIRDDYNINDLPVFDESNIVKMDSFRRRTLEDISNSVTIKFWDRQAGKESSITRADIAMVSRMGGTVNSENEYKGIANKELAEFVLSRDLRAQSTPMAGGAIQTTLAGSGLNPGDPFLLSWPRYGIQGAVVRVTAVEYGEFGKSSIRVEFAEDVFAISEAVYSAPPPSSWESPVSEPLPSPKHAAIELPFRLIAMESSKADALDYADNIGFTGIAGAKPSKDALSARGWFRTGSDDYTEEQETAFAPYLKLTSDIEVTEVTLPVSYESVDSIAAGMWGIIDDEIIRIDGGGEDTLNVGRGCLDTVPAEHALDTPILITSDFLAIDTTEYQDGTAVNAKLLPRTGRGTLALTDAPEQTITLNSRLTRPYSPARLRLNTLADPDEIIGDISIDWRHRDRTQQLERSINDTEDDINIGPETGTTYSYEVRKASDGTLLDSATGIGGNTTTALNTDIDYDGDVELTLWSVRDGYASWQKQLRAFVYLRTEPRYTESGEPRYTESGEYRIIEN